jgi:hypothetical protein
MNYVHLLNFETQFIESELYLEWGRLNSKIKDLINLLMQDIELLDESEALFLLDLIDEIEEEHIGSQYIQPRNILNYLEKIKPWIRDLADQFEENRIDWDEEDDSEEDEDEEEHLYQYCRRLLEYEPESGDYLNVCPELRFWHLSRQAHLLQNQDREIPDSLEKDLNEIKSKIKREPLNWTNKMRIDVVKLIEMGNNIDEVSYHYRVDDKTVRKWLYKY